MVRNIIADYYFYKLVCIDDDVELEYIGSTSNWKQRNRLHKSKCNNPNDKAYNTKKYQIIRANGGWDNWRMLEIGRREKLTLREAELIEEEYRQEHRAKLNMVRCFLTDEAKRADNKISAKKYYETHKDQIAEKQKEYNETHKDQIAEKRKVKVECKVCNCMITKHNIPKHNKTPKHKKNMGTQTEN
jgi:hypothetical protein